MGTRMEHYIVVGVNVGFDEDMDAQYSKYENIMNPEKGDFGCIYDGMSGEYVILGQVLDYALEYEGLDLNCFSISQIKEIFEDVRKKIQDYDVCEEIKLFVFTHVS